MPLSWSLGTNPFSMAAASTNGLNDEPVGRPFWVAMLNSKMSNPGPPTMARTWPVPGSIAARLA